MSDFKDKRFFTVVGGWVYFFGLVIISVFIVVTMIIYPDLWGALQGPMIALFILADIMAFSFIIFGKCLNYIRFTRDGVFHKNGKFDSLFSEAVHKHSRKIGKQPAKK